MKWHKIDKDLILMGLISLIAFFMLVMVAPRIAKPAEPSDVKYIANYLYTHPVNVGSIENPYGLPILATQLRFKVKILPDHDDYWWFWDEHIAYIWYYKNGGIIKLVFTIKHVERTSSSLQSLIFWDFIDTDLDGKVDRWRREFCVEPEREKGHYLTPKYPEDWNDFVADWSHPPRELAQKKFDEVVTLWVKHLKSVENADEKR